MPLGRAFGRRLWPRPNSNKGRGRSIGGPQPNPSSSGIPGRLQGAHLGPLLRRDLRTGWSDLTRTLPKRTSLQVPQSVIAITTLLVLLPGPAGSWDSDDLNLFRATLECEACDLSDANLVRTDLRSSKLTGTTLAGANLYYALLIGADLSAVDLGAVDLRGANLFYAILSGAKFHGTQATGANFAGANLREAVFEDADLRGANFFAANLSGAIFQATDLDSASLVRADLLNASIQRRTLKAAILCDTRMPDGTRSNRDC